MKHYLIAAAALCPAWTAAFAQDGENMRVRVGLGAQIEPEYIGADDMAIGPMIDVDIARGGQPFRFEAPDYSMSIPVYSSGGFSIGPAGNIVRKRKESDVGEDVGKVDTTFEAGVFAGYEVGAIHLRGELLKGLGGHEGVVGTIGADYAWRDGDRYVFSVGPRVLFSSKKYQRAYFGVPSDVALDTGLPEYDPDGGVHAIAAATGLSYQFNDRIGMFGYGRYERLVGDAADSPIVKEFGSRNQLSAGIGLSYTFIMAR